MQKYETVFIVDSLLKTEEIEAIIAKYERFISDNGGQIDQTEKWGKKRLQYEIKKRQYGYYVRILFDGPGAMIRQLEREYRLNESILRYATFKLTKQALKALEKEKTFSAGRVMTTEAVDSETEEEAAKVATETSNILQKPVEKGLEEEVDEVEDTSEAESAEELQEPEEEDKSE